MNSYQASSTGRVQINPLKKFFAASVTAALLITGALEVCARPHERNGVMFGLGAGTGILFDEHADYTSFAGNVRLGYAVRPDLVLQVEGIIWSDRRHFPVRTILRQDGTGETFDHTVTYSKVIGAITYYPRAGGIFLRGGIGVAHLDSRLSPNNNGFVSSIAFGYEWRFTSMFALAPELEYDYQNFDAIHRPHTLTVTLGFQWLE